MVWLALAIGNSRLHWARFHHTTLESVWHTPHTTIVTPNNGLDTVPDHVELWLASVVPDQSAQWQHYPRMRQIVLDDIPLQQLYPSLGIDRALASLGAGEIYGFPALVIDGGTALTFTGVNPDRQLLGGAILPGLKTQLDSLMHKTASLPPIQLPSQLPTRWATNTSEAMQSGIIYTVLAGIQGFVEAWCQHYSAGAIVLTGGDSELLLSYLNTIAPEISSRVSVDPNLIFWGIRAVRQRAC